ncbi:hypothetical protein [Chryseobacterium sp. MYb328]|uniref:hypothetical protein n=1 Tax=Chryseobacterium sp. MYb328 TaxID=2745231 RepID=UPI0030A7FF8F
MIKKLIEEIKVDVGVTFLKDYLPLIIFTPTILGGLTQFFIILKISPFLVNKCFSVSQLIIDGILTIVSLPLLFIGVLNYYSFIKLGLQAGITFLLLTLFGFFALTLIFYYQEDIYYFFFILSYFISNILIFLLFKFQRKDLKTRKSKIIYLLIFTVIFSIAIDTILTIIKDDNQIINFRNVRKELEKQYTNITYQYANDKYIIYKVVPKNGDDTGYIILEFQDLFKYNDLKTVENDK